MHWVILLIVHFYFLIKASKLGVGSNSSIISYYSGHQVSECVSNITIVSSQQV